MFLRYLRAEERNDLQLLLICFVATPLTWLLLMGWNGSDLISAQDGAAQLYPLLKEYLRGSGRWQDFQYRIEWVGGAKLFGYGLIFPLHRLFALFSLSPAVAMNLTVLFLQVVHGFLAAKASLELSYLFKKRADDDESLGKENLVTQGLHCLAMVWVFAFSPVMAWRMAIGHHNAAAGISIFLILFGLAICLQTKRFTLTYLAVAVVSLINAIPSAAQQYMLNAVVFGFPILLGLLWPGFGDGCWRVTRNFSKVDRRMLWGIPALLLLGAFMFELPRVAEVLAQALSTDSGRRLGGPAITYSYGMSRLADWWQSFFWYFDPKSAEIAIPPIHERNFPIGPPVLLLAWVRWKKNRALAIGLILSLLVAIGFAMRVEPIASMLIKAIPLLGSFRVPARAIVPFQMAVTLIGVAALLSAIRPQFKRASLLMAAIAALAFFRFDLLATEICVWVVLLVATVARLMRKPLSPVFAGPLLLLVLGSGTLVAFKQRLQPMSDTSEAERVASALGRAIKEGNPSFNNPLYRVHLDGGIKPFDINSPIVAGLSSISGYWFPPRRYLSLIYALENNATPATTGVYIRLKLGDQIFTALSALYNIQQSILPAPQGLQRVSNSVAGPAWFSESVRPTENFKTLAQELIAHGKDLAKGLHDKTWLVIDDWRYEGRALPDVTRECGNSDVESVEASFGSQDIVLKVKNNSLCPLIVSTNFATNLAAVGIDQQNSKTPLTVFPANGSLLGIWVPAGIQSVLVSARPLLPAWLSVFQWVGVALLIGLFSLASKLIPRLSKV